MGNPYGFPQYVIDRVMAKRGHLNVFDRFEPARTALLVIDMQNFYVGEIASVIGIIPNINRLARELRARGGLVAFVGMTAGEGGDSLWPIYHDYFFTPEKGANHRDQLSPGHPGHKFHADLEIQDSDVIVYKSRFSPFIQGASNIEEILRPRGHRQPDRDRYCNQYVLRVRRARCHDAGLQGRHGRRRQRGALPRGSPRRIDVVLSKLRGRAHDR